jgi:AraC-like DNA-binding protein
MQQPWHVELNYGGRVRWPPGVITDPSHLGYSDDYDLLYCWAGHGTVTTPVGEAPVFPGVVLLFRPGFRFLLRQDPANPLGQNYLHFSLTAPDGCAPELTMPYVMHPTNAIHVEAITSRIVSLLLLSLDFSDIALARTHPNRTLGGPLSSVFPRRDTPECAAATALLQGVLLDLQAECARQGAAGERREETARFTQIALRLLENPLAMPTVAALAAEYGYCPDHFTRRFRQLLGKSPKRFMQEQRLAKGETLLLTSRMPLKEIAAFLQFESEAYFSRLFTRYYGMSPQRYRQAHAPDAQDGRRRF